MGQQWRISCTDALLAVEIGILLPGQCQLSSARLRALAAFEAMVRLLSTWKSGSFEPRIVLNIPGFSPCDPQALKGTSDGSTYAAINGRSYTGFQIVGNNWPLFHGGSRSRVINGRSSTGSRGLKPVHPGAQVARLKSCPDTPIPTSPKFGEKWGTLFVRLGDEKGPRLRAATDHLTTPTRSTQGLKPRVIWGLEWHG